MLRAGTSRQVAEKPSRGFSSAKRSAGSSLRQRTSRSVTGASPLRVGPAESSSRMCSSVSCAWAAIASATAWASAGAPPALKSVG